MDSPHKLLDSSMDGLEADGRLRLPPNVTTLMAEDLRARLVLAADHEAAVHAGVLEKRAHRQCP